MTPMSAAANNAGYPPDVAGAPRAMAHAALTPDRAVKEEPEFVEWKIPVLVDTQTSPVILGWTTILLGVAVEPSVAVEANVFPPSVER